MLLRLDIELHLNLAWSHTCLLYYWYLQEYTSSILLVLARMNVFYSLGTWKNSPLLVYRYLQEYTFSILFVLARIGLHLFYTLGTSKNTRLLSVLSRIHVLHTLRTARIYLHLFYTLGTCKNTRILYTWYLQEYTYSIFWFLQEYTSSIYLVLARIKSSSLVLVRAITLSFSSLSWLPVNHCTDSSSHVAAPWIPVSSRRKMLI